MFRTYSFTLTTWSDVIDIRGRMLVGDLKPDGTPDVVSANLWAPADMDVRVTGCSHGNGLTMQEYVQGAGHIVCCASRQAWDDLAVFAAPCTTMAQVLAHPARVSGNER